MTAKEYLLQAKYLDQQINNKICQLRMLNDLATKVTYTMTGMPGGFGDSASKQDSVVTKIIDFQKEINADIDRLVDLKREILISIQAVSSVEHQLVLEKRYIMFEKWEKIAADMNTDIRNIYRIHGKALVELEKILADSESCH